MHMHIGYRLDRIYTPPVIRVFYSLHLHIDSSIFYDGTTRARLQLLIREGREYNLTARYTHKITP